MFGRILLLVTTTVLASLIPASPSAREASAAPPVPAWQAKVDAWVLDNAAEGKAEFIVFLSDQADLSGAAALPTKAEKGEYVYRTLTEHAERTQAPLRRALDRLGVEWRPFWVANMVWVSGGLNAAQALAERPDVAHLYANPQVKLDVPAIEAASAALLASPQAIEWNIGKVNADDVWAAGSTGAGVVIGGQDTGYLWTHNALKSHYRGWDAQAGTVDHDYNWHDAIHATGSICGADSLAPCDDHGHGTHTMGTMIGDDGGANQVGMAPGAKWIGCRNMNKGVGTPTTYAECYQWFIAPTTAGGLAPDPGMAPDVINNSWSCLISEGCTDPGVLLAAVQSVRAAGIVTVHSAGNEGSSCSTVADPAAIYAESFSVGATDSSDAIAGFSSRGPVTRDGSGRMKPNVSAPGVSIRSSTKTNDTAYGSMSGTSMAAPHVAGLVALLISANPNLRGDVDTLESIIERSAAGKTTSQGCGGDSPTAVPNNVYGWGRIDALAAYARAGVGAELSITHSETTGALSLTWTAVAGASTYRVWWSESPYFIPGGTCGEDPDHCTVVCDGTSVTLDVVAGSSSIVTWVVQPADELGAVITTLPGRVGKFDYALVGGS